jgi:HK97 family phage major capsid protein
MKNLDEVRSAVQELRDEIATLADLDDITTEQDARLDEAIAELPTREAELAKEEARAAVIERVRDEKTVPQRADSISGSFNHLRKRDTADAVAEDRAASPQQIIDAVTRQAEQFGVDESHVRKVMSRHRGDQRWSRNLLARSTDVYAEAFNKFLTGRELLLTNEERAALAVGTNTQGGFLLPTHLDPSIILTNDGSANIMRQYARVVTLTEGDTWNGISSAGVTASWDAELAEVSDDSPSVAQPTIPIYKAAAFVQASFEALQDINGLAGEVMMMFADAKDRLEGAAHMTGAGSTEPTGIFTAINAGGNETVSTTAATIGLVDLQATRRAVGQRWRGRSTWITNPQWGDEIKRLGTALSASYSTDITQANTDSLLGRPLVESDDAPTTATTTVLDERVLFGDLSNYVVVDKPGSVSVSFIPHMFATGNNLPNGSAGWYMYWRTGADSVNDAAFQLLMDKTSA